jgi:dephospho-CoA kinase
MQKKIIIGLVGGLAAGKGTIAQYAKEKYSASTHRFSTMLRDVLNRLYLNISRENMQLLSTILRKNFGEDLMAKVIAKDVEADTSQVVIVDGVRRFADIKYLRQIDGFILARVVADVNTRYQRLTQRGENEDDKNKTLEQFVEDHKKEADLEIPAVMDEADLEIDNNGNLDDLYSQLDKIINNS